MAQELREGDGKAGIARAGKRKWGYDPAQVDAFLERAHALYDSEGIRLTQRDIQSVSFDLTKDGYVIAQVDAALNRLERAVVDKQTAWEIAQHGRVTWKAQTENLYQQILEHVEREQGERFKPGEAKQPSYDKKQVDRLTDQIVDKVAASLGVDGVTEDDVRDLADLNAVSVSNVIFTQRKGKKGYDERQVDYFLNACVQLLSRIESYARVGGASANEPLLRPRLPQQRWQPRRKPFRRCSLPMHSARLPTHVSHLRPPPLMMRSMLCIRPNRICLWLVLQLSRPITRLLQRHISRRHTHLLRPQHRSLWPPMHRRSEQNLPPRPRLLRRFLRFLWLRQLR